MRLIADEMISPKIVAVVGETILRPGWELYSVYSLQMQGSVDEDLVTHFCSIGGRGLVSADQQMLKRESLIRAISETGLVGIYLPSFYAGLRRDEQLAYFVHWWKKIEIKIEEANPGTAWIVPRGLGGGEIREVPLPKLP